LTPIINIQQAVIHTDHKPILGLLKTPLNHLNNALATTVNDITQSGIKVAYIKGKNNILADALSRRSNFEIPNNQIQINTRPQMSDVETNPGPTGTKSRYSLQQQEVIARRKEIHQSLQKIKQKKGETTPTTVIAQMWEIHCIEKKDQLIQQIQNPDFYAKPKIQKRSYNLIPGDMWEMLANLDAPISDEKAVRKLMPEIQRGEWHHLRRVIPQLQDHNYFPVHFPHPKRHKSRNPVWFFIFANPKGPIQPNVPNQKTT